MSTAPRKLRLNPRGTFFDLEEILVAVSPMALPLSVEGLQIGWARRTRPQRSILLGAARPREGSIRIHPILDAEWVPEYVVRSIVYHEFCHCVAPPLSRAQAWARGESQRIHHADFRALEARNPDRLRTKRWVREHLPRLLSS